MLAQLKAQLLDTAMRGSDALEAGYCAVGKMALHMLLHVCCVLQDQHSRRLARTSHTP